MALPEVNRGLPKMAPPPAFMPPSVSRQSQSRIKVPQLVLQSSVYNNAENSSNRNVTSCWVVIWANLASRWFKICLLRRRCGKEILNLLTGLQAAGLSPQTARISSLNFVICLHSELTNQVNHFIFVCHSQQEDYLRKYIRGSCKTTTANAISFKGPMCKI